MIEVRAFLLSLFTLILDECEISHVEEQLLNTSISTQSVLNFVSPFILSMLHAILTPSPVTPSISSKKVIAMSYFSCPFLIPLPEHFEGVERAEAESSANSRYALGNKS